jgi:uncharacterized protein YaiL (DUF2058 family)
MKRSSKHNAPPISDGLLPNSRRWYFTTRHNTIQYLYVTEPLAMQLDTGALAIIERPDEADVSYALVDHEAAALIASIDPQWVRFYSDEPTDE